MALQRPVAMDFQLVDWDCVAEALCGTNVVIWTGDIAHGARIAHLAGVGFDPEVDQCISRVTSEGNFWGGVIYTNYSRRSIQMHMGGDKPGWATPGLLWMAFDYPFEQLGVEQVIAMVPSTNEKALNIDLRLGFEMLTLIPGAVEGGDLIILSMMRRECIWTKYGTRFKKSVGELVA